MGKSPSPRASSLYHSSIGVKFFPLLGCALFSLRSLYIDDRHNGQFNVAPNHGPYASLSSSDEYNFAAAQSAVFLVAFYLIRLGYFLGLLKSILVPQKSVPYLGFRADSLGELFYMLPDKQWKFMDLTQDTLKTRFASVKTLQRIAGECASFSLAVPMAR